MIDEEGIPTGKQLSPTWPSPGQSRFNSGNSIVKIQNPSHNKFLSDVFPSKFELETPESVDDEMHGWANLHLDG